MPIPNKLGYKSLCLNWALETLFREWSDPSRNTIEIPLFERAVSNLIAIRSGECGGFKNGPHQLMYLNALVAKE